MLPSRKKTWIKVLIGLLLFYLALGHLDFAKLAGLLAGTRPWLILLAFGVTVLHIATMIIIRTYLVNFLGTTGFLAMLKTFFSTTYFVNILPSRAGGLLGEPWGLYSFSRGKIDFNDALAFCLVITSAQNLRKIALTVVGLILFYRILPDYYAIMIMAAVALYAGYTAVIISAVLMSDKIVGLIEKYGRLVPKKVVVFVLSLCQVGRQTAAGIKRFLCRGIRVVSVIMALLINNTLFESFRLWILLWAFGVDFDFLYLLLFPSLAYSVTALPISLGGFGITEVSGLLVFKAFGLSPEIALAAVFLDRALSTYWTFLVGALLVPFIKLPRREDFSREPSHEPYPGGESG